MTKSETQLTLQEQLRALQIPYKGRYVPVNRLGPYIHLDDEQIDHIIALFQQALTSLKREMEKKKWIPNPDGGSGVGGEWCMTCEQYYPSCNCEVRNDGISECQRVMDKEF